MHKQNLSSTRTRLLVQQALIALVEKKALDRISVQELCEKALVSRATFYRLFADKYAVVKTIFDNALGEYSDEMGVLLYDEVSDITALMKEDRHEAAWARLFDHFATHSRLYSATFRSKGSAWFHVQMKKGLVKLFSHIIQGRHTARSAAKIPVSIARSFLVSAFIGVVETWLDEGATHPSARMASWFRRIFYKGYVGALSGLE